MAHQEHEDTRRGGWNTEKEEGTEKRDEDGEWPREGARDTKDLLRILSFFAANRLGGGGRV